MDKQIHTKHNVLKTNKTLSDLLGASDYPVAMCEHNEAVETKKNKLSSEFILMLRMFTFSVDIKGHVFYKNFGEIGRSISDIKDILSKKQNYKKLFSFEYFFLIISAITLIISYAFVIFSFKDIFQSKHVIHDMLMCLLVLYITSSALYNMFISSYKTYKYHSGK